MCVTNLSCFICGNAWMLTAYVCDVICIATMRPSFNFELKVLYFERAILFDFNYTSISSQGENLFHVVYASHSYFFCALFAVHWLRLVGNWNGKWLFFIVFGVIKILLTCDVRNTLWMNYLITLLKYGDFIVVVVVLVGSFRLLFAFLRVDFV